MMNATSLLIIQMWEVKWMSFVQAVQYPCMLYDKCSTPNNLQLDGNNWPLFVTGEWGHNEHGYKAFSCILKIIDDVVAQMLNQQIIEIWLAKICDICAIFMSSRINDKITLTPHDITRAHTHKNKCRRWLAHKRHTTARFQHGNTFPWISHRFNGSIMFCQRFFLFHISLPVRFLQFNLLSVSSCCFFSLFAFKIALDRL